MVNRIKTIYPNRLNKGSVQSSLEAPEFNTKHLKKAKGRISRNIVNITIKMKIIVQIL